MFDFPSLPDRWRIVSLLGYPENLLDPYHGNNWLKGDRPAFGEDWFFNLGVVSDSVIEPRRFPVPVAVADGGGPGSLDTIGNGEQQVYAENLIVEAVLYQGNTVFQPPDWEFRFTPVFNFNHAEVNEPGILKADPAEGTTRTEGVIGVQALFVDKHLRNVSDNYDFDSLRVGIQPFTTDFRGFLFQDSPFGVRLFGTRDSNRWQYNLAWFRRLEKDTNSGLNNLIELGSDAFRDDDVFVANLYRQDFPRPGFTSQLVVAHNRNREGGDIRYDDNGFIQRPSSLGLERARDYDVTYLGYNGDGHLGRWNLSRLRLRRARRGGPRHLHRPAGRHPRLLHRGRGLARLRLDPRARHARLRLRRRRSLRRRRQRLRRDLREPDDRRRRHQLLDPPARAADRRRPRGALGTQWPAELAALLQGVRPVELHQPGPDARGRRRRPGPDPDAARERERQLPAVRGHGLPRGGARAGGHRPSRSASTSRSRSPGGRSRARTSSCASPPRR